MALDLLDDNPFFGLDKDSIAIEIDNEIGIENEIGKNETGTEKDAKDIASLCGVNISKLAQNYNSWLESLPNKSHDNSNNDNVNKPKNVDDGPPQLLWLEKYKPTRPTNLLADDRTIRDILRWLKGWSKTNTKGGVERKKVLLVHGPPGSGKTTLAHVLAKHCGYRPLELNASDERTDVVVKTTITQSLSNNSALLPNTRPTCLIIDDLDGSGAADRAFIKSLVRLLKAKNIQRPIICLCNDMYTSALYPLRAISHCVKARPADLKDIGHRLAEICKCERVHADNAFLSSLCSSSNGDIRAAINCLQLVLPTDHDTDRKLKVNSDQTHLKQNLNLYKLIFKLGKGLNRGYAPTLDAFNSLADSDKLLNECFHNYHLCEHVDNSLKKAISSLEWLTMVDSQVRVREFVHAKDLKAYSDYAVYSFHKDFASVRPLTAFNEKTASMLEREFRQSSIEFFGVLEAYRHETWPKISNETLRCDVLSFLISIIGGQALAPADAALVLKDYGIDIETVSASVLGGVQMSYLPEICLVPAIDSVLINSEETELSPKRKLQLRQVFVDDNKTRKLLASDQVRKHPLTDPLKDSRSATRQCLSPFLLTTTTTTTTTNNTTTLTNTTTTPTTHCKFVAKVSLKWHDGFSNAVHRDISVNELISKFHA